MDAKHPVGRRIRQHFDKTVRLGIGPCPRIGRERKFADPIFDAGRLQFLLGLADRSGLRPGVDDRRDRVVIHFGLLSRQALDNRDAFFFGLVRQHRPADDIADRIDAGHVCREPIIDRHPPRWIARDPDLFEAEPVCERPPADRDEHDIGSQALAFAAFRRLEL